MLQNYIRLSSTHPLDSNHHDDVNVTRKRPLYSNTEHEERTLYSIEVGAIQQTTAVLPTPSPITPQPSIPKLIAPSLFPLTSTTSPLQTSTAPPQLWPSVEPSTSPKQVSSLEPPPPSHSIQHEKNSVHGYSGNTLNKRRRTGDDLLDAFLEISDIMTYNQMQPITHAHIQNSSSEVIDSNTLVNSEIEMLDIENTVHNNRDSETGKKNKKNRNNNGDRIKQDKKEKERKQLRFQQYQESKRKGNG